MHIAFCGTDSYTDYMGTVMYSVLQQHSNEEITFHIFSADMKQYSREKLKKLENNYVIINFQEIDKSLFESFPEKENISREAYFRFCLPSLLPECKRVIYLDCDTLVVNSLIDFWEVDLTDNYVAGVNESDMLNRNKDYRHSIGFLDDDVYINSGVMLMNLEKMREDNIEQKLFATAHEFKDIIQYQDQDVINLTLKGHIKAVSSIYNYTSYEREINRFPLSDVAIIHYNWHKPWDKKYDYLNYNRVSFDLWKKVNQRYLNHVEELVSVIIPVQHIEYIGQCVDSVLHQEYQNMDIMLLADKDSKQLLSVADRYRQQDSRIRIITCNNRDDIMKQGVHHALGRYITVLLDKDWWEGNFISELKKSLDTQQADVAVTSFMHFSQERGVFNLFNEDLPEQSVVNASDLVKNMYAMRWFEKERHLGISCKLYKKNILQKVVQLFSGVDDSILAQAYYVQADQVAISVNKRTAHRVLEGDSLSGTNVLATLTDLERLTQFLSLKQLMSVHYVGWYSDELKRLASISRSKDDVTTYNQLTTKINNMGYLDKLT